MPTVQPRRRGFTLLETLLYVAVFGVLVAGMGTFTAGVMRVRGQYQSRLEVIQQGTAALRAVTAALRDAAAVNMPSIGTSSTGVSLAMADAAASPTMIAANDGVLYLTVGTAAPVPLTDDRVAVSGLTFTNFGRSGTPGAVGVSFRVTSNAPDSFSLTFRGAGAVHR